MDDDMAQMMMNRTWIKLICRLVIVTGIGMGHAVITSAQDSALVNRLEASRQNPTLNDQLVVLGRKAAAVCAYCHGDGGNSVKPDVPNLAGQNTAYLLEQIQQFSDGRRRNEFMQGLMKALKPDEKVKVALFFSNQKVNPPPAIASALVSKGKSYYDRLCFRCHGTDGHSNEKIARIASQQVPYLTVPQYLRKSNHD
jgi:cytochrome c553